MDGVESKKFVVAGLPTWTSVLCWTPLVSRKVRERFTMVLPRHFITRRPLSVTFAAGAFQSAPLLPEQSLFWVQTRTIQCNYCMGHCEMLLEVAGLDKKAVAERTKRLAGDDWSCFTPTEQRAYAYARKLTATPWDLTAADYKALEKDQGADKAMFTFWWLCRGLYMTRISDGFQLPLERENVFGESPKKQ